MRPADAFGPACWGTQQPGAPSVAMSEDCLTLNVWQPPRRLGPPKAVMVRLHGGGFQFGSSADPKYDGAALAARGVEVVSLNYRLGVFGFLAQPELDREAGSSGGFGLQDQIAALRWVQRNIAAFGGDPGNVTLFGQSAGAHAVGMLMASPQTYGLGHRRLRLRRRAPPRDHPVGVGTGRPRNRRGRRPRPPHPRHDHALRDLRALVRLLRTNATAFGPATERIGLFGHADGAYLAALAA